MNEKIEQIKQSLAALLDKTEDKDTIGAITNINTNLAAVEEDYKTQDGKYRELLGNYKEVIKYTSFKPDGNEKQDKGTGLPKEQSLDDIISDVIAKIKK